MRLDRIGWLWLALLLVPASTRAGPYDVIVVDSLNATLCQGCGITMVTDYGLVVNTGTADITIPEIQAASFVVTSSVPGITLNPFLNIPTSDFQPIHPGEAVGSPAIADLLTLLLPGETFRHAGGQFMSFGIERGFNTYEGPVEFDVRMVLAGYTARFRIGGHVSLGNHAVSLFGAHRLSSSPAGEPPSCALATAAPSTLSPANRQFVPIILQGVVDPEGGPLAITVTHITQDEPVDPTKVPPDSTGATAAASPVAVASPDGAAIFLRAAAPQRVSRRQCEDAQIVDGQALLKAERDFPNGRVYAVHFQAVDMAGNRCSGIVTACVPGRNGTCVDDGQNFRSLDDSCPATTTTDLVVRARTVAPGITQLQFVLEEAADVELAIYDVTGRKVEALDRGRRQPGEVTVRWNAAAAAAGVYFARLEANGRRASRPIIVR